MDACKYLQAECQEDRAGSFQRCPVTGRGTSWSNFTVRVMEHWIWLPTAVVCSLSQTLRTHLDAFLCPCCGELLLGVGFHDLQRSLSTTTVL